MFRRLLLVCAAAVLLALGIAACGGDDSESSGDAGNSEEPITIGAVVSESGFMSFFDVPSLVAAELAIENINAEGGVLGRPLELEVRDMKTEPEEGAAIVREIADDVDVILTTGEFDIASPTALAAQENDKLSVSVCCAGSELFGPKGGLEMSFSSGVLAAAVASAAAEWAAEEQGWKTAFQLIDDTLKYDLDYADAFAQRWEQLNGEGSIVGSATFKNDDASIQSQITAIRNLDTPPDVISLATYAPGGSSALRQLRAAGIDTPIILGDAMDGGSWVDAVPNLTDAYLISHAAPFGEDEREGVNEVVAGYRERTGEDPPISLFVDGYVAIQLIAAGIEGAGSLSGAEITEALASMGTIDTVAGPTTFTSELHTAADRSLVISSLSADGGEAIAVVEAQEVAGLD